VTVPLPDPPLADERVALRAWAAGDESALVAGWADPEVQRWTGVPQHREAAHARAWIDGEASRRSAHLALDLAITDAATGGVLGEVGLARFDRTRRLAEVGYWLLPGERGRGAATAALQLLVPWAFGALDLGQVFARIEPANEPSAGVVRAAGFVRKGNADGFEVWSCRAGEGGATLPS
jgi:RimJ/RimL family protein N-acetyltransferase